MRQAHIAPKKNIQFIISLSRLPYLIPMILVILALLICIICINIITSWSYITISLLTCIITSIIILAVVHIYISRQQKEQQNIIANISSICQTVIEGKVPEQLQIPHMQKKHAEITNLANVVNTLLGSYVVSQEAVITKQEAVITSQQELTILHEQIEQLTRTLQPVADGDLRIAHIPVTGKLKAITTICTELVEDTAQFVHWTQDMSEHIIQIAHQLMSQSIEITRSTEKLVEQDKTTIHTLETLVILTQRLEQALSSNFEVFQESWTYLHQKQRLLQTPAAQATHTPSGQSARLNLLPGVLADEPISINPADKQPASLPLLADLLHRAHEIAHLAENTSAEHDAFAQIVYQINEVIMQFSGMVSLLATLADRWRQATENYTLPTDKIA